jgi:tRNA nucleotidyltransferase/poly(A) polymerase
VSVLPALAERVAVALAGYETRAVGGWVRSLLRGEPMAGVECDLATTATPEQMEAAFKTAGLAYGEEGKRWGALKVGGRGQEAGGREEEQVEITTLRQDSYRAGSRYPDVTWTTDWAVDAARRDFTFNAIYLSGDGTAFDPYGGQNDLAAGKVAFIGDPAARLREDPLRWLRFWRFCAVYGLGGYTPELHPVLDTAAPALRNLSHGRVAREWERLQSGAHAAEVLSAIRRAGWMRILNERLRHGESETE